MAGKRARRTLSDLDDPSLFAVADCLGGVTQLAKLTVLEVLNTPGISEDQISVFLISKFGLRKFDILREAVSMVPLLFSSNRLETIEEFFPSLREFVDLPNAILLADFLTHTTVKEQRCFGPQPAVAFSVAEIYRATMIRATLCFLDLKGPLQVPVIIFFVVNFSNNFNSDRWRAF